MATKVEHTNVTPPVQDSHPHDIRNTTIISRLGLHEYNYILNTDYHSVRSHVGENVINIGSVFIPWINCFMICCHNPSEETIPKNNWVYIMRAFGVFINVSFYDIWSKGICKWKSLRFLLYSIRDIGIQVVDVSYGIYLSTCEAGFTFIVCLMLQQI